VKADQVDIFTGAVFGDFEQVEDAEESRFAGQSRSDVREADRFDRIHLDFAFFHAIAAARFYAGTLPDADAAGDVSATNPIAEALGEHHGRECTPVPGLSLERAARLWRHCGAFVAFEKLKDGQVSGKMSTALQCPKQTWQVLPGFIIASGAVDPTTSKTQITFQDFSTSNISLAVFGAIERTGLEDEAVASRAG
jgi:hypothetical protein